MSFAGALSDERSAALVVVGGDEGRWRRSSGKRLRAMERREARRGMELCIAGEVVDFSLIL